MTTDTLKPENAADAAGGGEKMSSPFNDALASAQAKISETARAAQKAIQENEALATAQAKLAETAKAAQKAIQENEALAAAQAKLAETAKAAQKAIQESEALSTAQAKLTERAKAAQDALKGHADALMERTKDYRENAGQQLNDAQEYLVERIKERPVTAAFTGLGVGLILGLLLANRSR